jgi:hypothetical protein
MYFDTDLTIKQIKALSSLMEEKRCNRGEIGI